MPLYWVKRNSGVVVGEITAPNPVPHSEWLMIDVPSLPGPIETVRWDGTQMVIDTGRTDDRKTELRKSVWSKLDKPFTVTVSAKDYTFSTQQLKAVIAMEARARRAVAQSDATWTLLVQADDSSYATFTAADVIDMAEKIGNRMRNRWNNVMAKQQALDAATATDLATFDPEVN